MTLLETPGVCTLHLVSGRRREDGALQATLQCNCEDILSPTSFSISLPPFPEDLVFPYCLWGHQNPSLCPSLSPAPEFLLSLPSPKPPRLYFLLPTISLLDSAADFPFQLICERAPWSREPGPSPSGVSFWGQHLHELGRSPNAQASGP